MMIMNIYGHVVIICIGVPIIFGLVKSMREVRIQSLLFVNIDKMKADFDALNQIFTIQQMIKGCSTNQTEDVSLIGIVNLHVLECTNSECPCKSESSLFDAATGKFSNRNSNQNLLKK